MKKLRMGKSLLTSKGFYAVLAVSLVAVGSAAWIGINSTLDRLERDDSAASSMPPMSSLSEWEPPVAPPTAQVVVPKVDVEEEEEVPVVEQEKPVVQGFVLPVSGDVINKYSDGEMVKSATMNDWRTHDGVDIAALLGTPVKACNAGKVSSVTEDAMWGHCVTIVHADGTQSCYSNLAPTVNVTKGQRVRLGEIIGAVGESATIEQKLPAHLHFGVKRDNAWIDPLSLSKK